MGQDDIIHQLRDLCDRLRAQLMRNPEYRALMSLERTIEDLSACTEQLYAPEHMQATMSAAPNAPAQEPAPLDVNSIDAGISMRQGADQLAEALADALQRKPQPRPVDHLPSHRVA